MITNNINGQVKKLSKEGFFNMIDLDLHGTVAEMLCAEGTTGMVVYENLDLCSSNCGHRTFMVFGSSKTYKTIEEAAQLRLGDVPSRFEYAVGYYTR